MNPPKREWGTIFSLFTALLKGGAKGYLTLAVMKVSFNYLIITELKNGIRKVTNTTAPGNTQTLAVKLSA